MRKILSIFLMQMAVILGMSTAVLADDVNLTDEIYLENEEADVEIETDDSFLFIQNLTTDFTSWQIKNSSEKRGKKLHLEKGKNIKLILNLSNTSGVTAGIVRSDGVKKHISVQKSINTTVQISKTGTYSVFVKNKSGKKITVSGYYSY